MLLGGSWGGGVGSATRGPVRTTGLPHSLTPRTAALHLPPQAISSLPKTGSANAILDPTLLGKLPAAFVQAIRLALSDTLHDIYIFAGVILVIALGSTVFLQEVPLTVAAAARAFAH